MSDKWPLVGRALGSQSLALSKRDTVLSSIVGTILLLKFMLLDITGNWAGSPAGSHGYSSFEDPSGHTGSGDHKGSLH